MSYPEETSLAMLRHPKINENPIFLKLKRHLQRYIRERRKPLDKQNLHREMSLTWRDSLYKSLQRLLAELVNTRDHSAQVQMLDKIYSWFKTQTRLSLPPIKKKMIYVPTKPSQTSLSPAISTRCSRHSHISPQMPSAFSSKIKGTLIKQRASEEAIKEDLPLTSRNSRDKPRSVNKTKNTSFLDISPEGSPLRKTITVESSNTTRVFDFTKQNTGALDVMDAKDHLNRRVFFSQYSELSPMRKLQFREIAYSKIKLASRNIKCPVKSLENALLSPDIPDLDLVKPFPEGGRGLISWPLHPPEPVKKKTKRKKK